MELAILGHQQKTPVSWSTSSHLLEAEFLSTSDSKRSPLFLSSSLFLYELQCISSALESYNKCHCVCGVRGLVILASTRE